MICLQESIIIYMLLVLLCHSGNTLLNLEKKIWVENPIQTCFSNAYSADGIF